MSMQARCGPQNRAYGYQILLVAVSKRCTAAEIYKVTSNQITYPYLSLSLLEW